MPKVYRTMWCDADKPRLGDLANCLGVRTSPSLNADLVPSNGVVKPGIGGMSVAPHWTSLPPFLIPKHLEHLVKGARAKSGLRCFSCGSGRFEAGQLAKHLSLRIDGEHHGLVEPAFEMPIEEFQERLAETQSLWKIDEEI